MLALGDLTGAALTVAAFVLGLLVGLAAGHRRRVHLSLDIDDDRGHAPRAPDAQ